MIQEPDNLEKVIRFGCGALIGLAIGFLITLRFILSIELGFAAVISVALAGICGLLAVKHGDEFWYSLKDWLGW